MARRALAPILLLAAATMLTSAPAHAESWTHRDATGDVSILSYFEGTSRPAPRNTDADVRRVAINHSERAVRLVARVGSMPRSRNMTATVGLKSGVDDLTAQMVVNREAGRTTVEYYNVHGGQCRRASARFVPNQRKVVVSVPRHCLGDPAWVRAWFVYTTYVGSEVTATEGAVDDGLRNQRYREPGHEGWSPRIQVG
ncbi:hypothetical protein [Nocardioides sp. GXZ039]|uniref:hypothetical protein n=1 Tax=Nocardioides sp. GXZ039 TaxID=3136018 RepID=UPI0030F4620D